MIVVAYASKHGATEGIARCIAERLRERGRFAEALEVGAVTDVEHAEAVVLGSAVYAGSWLHEAVEFARRQEHALAGRPVWLFSSGPLGTEVTDEHEQPRQLDEFRRALRPRDHRMFFGALDPERLGVAERLLVKAVRAPAGDFRDWRDIRSWADSIAEALAPVG